MITMDDVNKVYEDFKKLRSYFMDTYPQQVDLINEKWLEIDSRIPHFQLEAGNHFKAIENIDKEEEGWKKDLYLRQIIKNFDEYFNEFDMYLKSFITGLKDLLEKINK